MAEQTGLLIDAYFSGTKIRWLLDNVPGARERAERGELCVGTVDSWLIWKLTGGAAHVTDYSNASRTMLFNIHTLRWDEELCEIFGIPRSILPPSRWATARSMAWWPGTFPGWRAWRASPSAAAPATSRRPCSARPASTPGEAKNTYGTGCFTLMNVGREAVRSRAGLVTSVGWSIGGETSYALEGSVFNAGSTIQWLRDELKLIDSAPECDRLAESVPDSGGVVIVPAFTGLGAPYWDMYARGTILGLTRGSTRAHIARAVLDAIALQVTDLVRAMNADAPCPIPTLRVDGGASVSDILMQIQADLLRHPRGPARPGGDHGLRRGGPGGPRRGGLEGYRGAGKAPAEPARLHPPPERGGLRPGVPAVAAGRGAGPGLGGGPKLKTGRKRNENDV